MNFEDLKKKLSSGELFKGLPDLTHPSDVWTPLEAPPILKCPEFFKELLEPGLDGKRLAKLQGLPINSRERYGVPYTEDEISKFVANPVVGVSDLLSEKEEAFLQEQMQRTDRVVVSSEQSASFYSGPWYLQGFEGSCTAISLLNAITVLNLPAPIPLITALRNAATNNDDLNISKHGLSITALFEITAKHETNFKLVAYPIGEGIEPISPSEDDTLWNKPIDPAILKKFKIHVNEDKFPKVFSYPIHEPPTNEQILRTNAKLIKDAVDQGFAILESVFSDKLWPDSQSKFTHAIAICGYRINDKGFMDIQILDSDKGKYWVALEHLSKAVRFSSATVVKPKSSNFD